MLDYDKVKNNPAISEVINLLNDTLYLNTDTDIMALIKMVNEPIVNIGGAVWLQEVERALSDPVKADILRLKYIEYVLSIKYLASMFGSVYAKGRGVFKSTILDSYNRMPDPWSTDLLFSDNSVVKISAYHFHLLIKQLIDMHYDLDNPPTLDVLSMNLIVSNNKYYGGSKDYKLKDFNIDKVEEAL